jgi:hypothetical protein
MVSCGFGSEPTLNTTNLPADYPYPETLDIAAALEYATDHPASGAASRNFPSLYFVASSQAVAALM